MNFVKLPSRCEIEQSNWNMRNNFKVLDFSSSNISIKITTFQLSKIISHQEDSFFHVLEDIDSFKITLQTLPLLKEQALTSFFQSKAQGEGP